MEARQKVLMLDGKKVWEKVASGREACELAHPNRQSHA